MGAVEDMEVGGGEGGERGQDVSGEGDEMHGELRVVRCCVDSLAEVFVASQKLFDLRNPDWYCPSFIAVRLLTEHYLLSSHSLQLGPSSECMLYILDLGKTNRCV